MTLKSILAATANVLAHAEFVHEAGGHSGDWDVAGPQPLPRGAVAHLTGLDSVPLARPLPNTYNVAERLWQELSKHASAISALDWQYSEALREVRQAEDIRMREDALERLVALTPAVERMIHILEEGHADV